MNNVSYKRRISTVKNFIACPKMYKYSIMSEKSKIACARGSVIDERVTAYVDSRFQTDLDPKYKAIIDQLNLPSSYETQKTFLYGDHGGTCDLFSYDYQTKIVYIWDWKTGRSKADPMQLKHYSWLASKEYPDAVEFVTYFVYLEQTLHTVMYVFVLEDLAVYEGFYKSVVASIEESEAFDVWPATASWKCTFCSLKSNCGTFAEQKGNMNNINLT